MDPFIGQLVMAVARNGPNGINLLGSAFAVAAQQFATAAHVLQQSDSDLFLVINSFKSLNDYQDTSVSQFLMVSISLTSFDPVRDIAILTIREGYVKLPYKIVSSDHATPGTSIVSVGFPHVNHGRIVLTQQGSTVGARIMLSAGPVKTKHLTMNVQTRPGQSGSPVYVAGKNEVCAMIIGSYAFGGGGGVSVGGIDPQTLHQTIHAISAEYIRDML